MSTGYEKRDIQLRPLLFAGIAIIVLVIVSALLMAKYYRSLNQDWQPHNPYAFEGTAKKTEVAPELLLQTNPVRDLKEMREKEKLQLTGYHRLNEKDKTIRIPIERAMELIAERGLADKSKAEVAS